MRELIRRWLGIEEQEEEIRAIRIKVNYDLEKDIKKLGNKFEEINQKTGQLLDQLKLPHEIRLAQLHGGLGILTQFANELQKDIKGWNK